jgi:peptide/nickel transport system substrate-binding protein
MIRFALAIALAVVTLTACSSGRAATHRDPTTLVVLEEADGQTLNPLYAQSQVDAVIYQALLFDALCTLGPGFAPAPDLATSWTPSAGGLVWDVTLRRGVRWSDGVPFTVRDVLFSFRIMRDPKTAYIGAGSLENVRDVRATGPFSVRFTLKHVTAQFAEDVLENVIVPEHVLGATPPDRQLYTAFGERPIGTGPYVLRRWQHDTEATFDRNPRYWGSPPKIAHVDFRIIFNDQAMVDALENGSADLIDYLAFNQSVRLTREAPQIKQSRALAIELGVIEPNLRRPGLSDVAVRKAMMYAHDRQAIVDGFFDGQAALATSYVPQALTRWYDPAVTKYPYDPQRARALLESAGWKRGPDGVRAKGGVRLSFDVLVNQGSPILLAQVLAFAADLSAVGIQINARLLDFPSIVERSYTGRYDMLFDVRGVSLPDPKYLFLSTQIPPAGGNTVFYVDPETDRLIAAGLTELSYPKRRAIYDRLQAHLADTLPMLWDINAESRMAFTPRLSFDPKTTLPFPYSWYSVTDWRLAP